MPGQARRVGAYAKLLANYASDDALIAAGEKAELLFVRGLAFCATSDSDGFITESQVIRYVGAGMRDAKARATALVREGVWEKVDGGYHVRSWLKIHESSTEKGRRLKADRERKRVEADTPTLPLPDGIATDSEQPSERIPRGFQNTPVPDSLSMTEQRHDRTGQGTTESGSLGEDRNETLAAPDATKPPPGQRPTIGAIEAPSDARCTKHRGVRDPGPCAGCRAARELAEQRAARAADQAGRAAEAAARACTRCDGVWVVDPKTSLPTRRKCDHRRTA